jgi:hypothetical protein
MGGKGEMIERRLVDPTSELSDDTPIENVRFSTRTRYVISVGAGEVPRASSNMQSKSENVSPLCAGA